MTLSVLPWGSIYLDESLDEYTAAAFDIIEVHCSTIAGGNRNAPATLYTCPNMGKDVEWLFARAKHLGHGVII